MISLLSLFSAGLLFLFFLLILWMYRTLWSPFQLFKRKGINGPTPEPLFGNSRLRHKVGLLQFITDISKEYGPISGFYFGQMPILLVLDLEILKQVLVKEFDSFMDRRAFPDLLRKKGSPRGLLTSQGTEWKVSRQTLSPTFSAAKMKMMVPLMEKSVKSLLGKIKESADSGHSVNIFKVFGSFTMETIVATAFGRVIDIQGGDNDELTDAADLIFRGAEEGKKTSFTFLLPILSNFPYLDPVLRYFLSRSKRGLAVQTLQETALSIIEARRESGFCGKYKDVLQLMMDASLQEEEGEQSCPVGNKKLSGKQIVSHSLTFFLAGYETTANTLSYTAYLLALYPEIQEKLQKEIDSYLDDNPNASLYEATQEISYLDMVVQESLRIFPPAPVTERYCRKTVTINGLTINEGITVMVPIAHLHKSPEYWDEPEKFNPERFSAEEKAKRPPLCYMPFGYGPRNCIGMRFALLEAKLALMEVLKKFTFVRSPDTEVPLETVVGITMAPKNGIYIKLVSRH